MRGHDDHVAAVLVGGGDDGVVHRVGALEVAFEDHALRGGQGRAVLTCAVVMASVLLARYDWEFPELHMLYEFSGLVAIGIVYSYAQQMKPRRFLIYGGGGLFLMGLALRSLFMT